MASPHLQTNWFTEAARKRILGLRVPDLAISAGLLLSVFAVYAQVVQFGFIRMDDDLYVVRNAAVQAGLTPATIKWALTGVTSSNWMPVTMLSHMLDVQLFGLNSGMHHLVNVLLHALSAVMLFVVLHRATGARGASAFVAFIFALHPLHVESVAWISERKDVLSTLFFFLALYAYVRYTEHPSVRSYLPMLGFYCLGLMSKPMLVTFPFVLLLFDFWPLRRREFKDGQWPKILWEKVPLLVLSAAVSVIAYRVQRDTGALIEAVPLDGRICKALFSYMTYIRQTLWPAGLGVFYPYPRYILASRAAVALAILVAVSVLVIRQWRRRPYLATGWFWYLGTLVPVIGLVKVGEQSHADRYTYIPMMGLSLMLAWAAQDLVRTWPRTKSAIAAAAVIVGGVCLVLTAKQASYWQNGETLYEHAIAVIPDNWLAHGNLGLDLMYKPDRVADAIEHFETALRIRPNYPEAQNDLGLCLSRVDLCGPAIPHFEAALLLKPDSVEAHNNLAQCLAYNGDYLGAIAHLRTALRIKPDFPEAHLSLATTLAKVPGGAPEAIAHFETGLRLAPGYAAGHRNFALLLLNLGRTAEAIFQFEAAQRIQPDAETSKILDQLRASPKG